MVRALFLGRPLLEVAEGIPHVQLVVDPITVDSIERLGAVLEALDSRNNGGT